jgi:glycerol-3-phosphate dehydrogenase (NAD(P)+)
MSNIAVIGAGGWGTALALTLSRLGHGVRLWAYEEEVVESIRQKRENELCLPGFKLPDAIIPTTNLSEALDEARFVLTVMPSHVCRTLYEQMLPFIKPEMILVSATKGLETETLMRMSEVIRSIVARRFEPHLAVLSGPSFAQEVARGDPTAVVVASDDQESARLVQKAFSSATLRLYTSSDVTGVELGGAVKTSSRSPPA